MPPTRTASLRTTLMALPLLLAGCGLWRPAVVPMPQRLLPAPAACASPSSTPKPLVVMLPGRVRDVDEFGEHGFVQAMHRRGIDADVVLADAHLGYYRDRSVLTRLEADVLAPARRRGVTQVWLVGISLGGFGGLLLSEARPGDVSGVVLLGPYLGEPETLAPVKAVGSLQAWTPPPGLPPVDAAPSQDVATRQLWRWLRQQAARPLPQGVPPVWLGYGEDDRFRDEDRLLAGVLPAGRVLTHPGGHDWDAWVPLWDAMLDRLPLPRRAACVAG